MKEEELDELEYSHDLAIKNIRNSTKLNRSLICVMIFLFIVGAVSLLMWNLEAWPKFIKLDVFCPIIGSAFVILMITMIVIFYKTACIFKNLLISEDGSSRVRASCVIWLIVILMILDMIYWILKTVELTKIYSYDPPR